MRRISIQGKYSTAEKNTHCTNIIELVNQEIWHTSEILKNKPGLQKHYNTMAWKHIYREYRVQHRETFRVWERLASFCNSFFPPFSLFEVRHTKHTKGRLAQPKTSEKSSTLLLVKYAVVLQTQTAVEHRQWNTELNERKSLAFEKIWQLS